MLRESGLDPLDASYLLANVLPRLITTEINPAASRGALKGGFLDLVERMRSALPVELDCIAKEEWLDLRRTTAAAAAKSVRQPEEEERRRSTSPRRTGISWS